MRRGSESARREDATTMDPSTTALLRRRRLFLLGVTLLAGLLTADCLLLAVRDGSWPGFVLVAGFGLGTAAWGCRLLTPTDDLLALPASYFYWIAPSDSGKQDRPAGIRHRSKPAFGRPEANPSGPAMWDRDLDGDLSAWRRDGP